MRTLIKCLSVALFCVCVRVCVCVCLSLSVSLSGDFLENVMKGEISKQADTHIHIHKHTHKGKGNKREKTFSEHII